MTTITNTLAASRQTPQFAAKPAGSMDQTDFLRLMTTQLTTQDPFNPVDNTEMVAQMAQFSQVAGIAEMNKSLQTIAAGLTPGRLTDAASWIGRSILVESDVATPQANGGYGGEIALPSGADQVSVSYVDERGAVVHSETLGAQGKGAVPFHWDGRNAAGEMAAGGPLRIVVEAISGSEATAPATATWTTVGGIQSPANGGATQLLTGLGLLTPEEVIRLA